MRIEINEDLTLQELEQKILKGYRFITFQYCISFIAVTQRKFSKAFLIANNQDLIKYSKKYNLISSIFGWWGIPWRPISTFNSFEVNKKGGIDVTEDIMLNINEDTLKRKEIELTKTNQFFDKPNKWNLKAFKKSILRDFELDSNVESIIVGMYINTDKNINPFLTIGLKIKDNKFNDYLEPIKNSLSREFMKHVQFKFIDLNMDKDLTPIFEKQGEKIK